MCSGAVDHPLSMLAGSASMQPGRVESTEVTIVGLPSLHALPIGLAMLAALGMGCRRSGLR